MKISRKKRETSVHIQSEKDNVIVESSEMKNKRKKKRKPEKNPGEEDYRWMDKYRETVQGKVQKETANKRMKTVSKFI